MSSRIMVDAGPGGNPPAEPTPEAPERREPEPLSPPPERETPAPEPAEEPTEAEKQAALQKRIDRLNWEKHEAIRQRDETRAEYQRWVDSMQRQNQPPPSQDYQRGLYEAQQAQVANEFNRACDTLFNRGVEEFGPEMGEARDRLVSVGYGPNRPDALAALTRLPNGHRVYRELARDLDKAAHILSLDPVRMVDALTDLRYQLEGGHVSQARDDSAFVSRAPEPVSRIGGNSRPSERPLDHPQTSMAEFIRRRDRDERRSRIQR